MVRLLIAGGDGDEGRGRDSLLREQNHNTHTHQKHKQKNKGICSSRARTATAARPCTAGNPSRRASGQQTRSRRAGRRCGAPCALRARMAGGRCRRYAGLDSPDYAHNHQSGLERLGGEAQDGERVRKGSLHAARHGGRMARSYRLNHEFRLFFVSRYR